MESLEPRRLLSAFTADEVYLAELINRARSDPQAEALRLGLDLTANLSAEELALFGPVEPLALNLALTTAARAHSLDMQSRGFFDHINPDGLNPTERAWAAGYSGTAGESIGAAQLDIDDLYISWMESAANRINILSLFPEFTESFHYDHIGPGFTTGNPEAEDHFTSMFGDPGVGTTAWLLGVVYDDLDGDAFYTPGEGAANVRIDVASAAAPNVVIATFTTDEAGNYQLEMGDGAWIVTFTDIATGEFVQKATTTNGKNAKLDALVSQFEPPPGDGGGGDGGGDGGGGDGGGDGGATDDHANDGDFANATLIVLDSGGAAAASGRIEVATDTDLFYFTTFAAGEITVTLDTSAGALLGEITLRDAAGLAIAIESAENGETSVVLTWNVPAAAQYFLAIGAAGQTSAGEYSLAIAPSDGSGGGDGSGGDGDNGAENDSPPVDLTSDSAGGLVIVRADSAGRPIVYLQQEDGSWVSVDLVAEAGGPTPEGRFSTFIDPESGRPVIVSATSDGLAIYARDAFGGWSLRNLSVELGAAPIATKPVTFTTRTGLVYTAGLDENGNLVAYHHTGETDSGGDRVWSFADITTDHLAAQGFNMPALSGGSLIAYVTAWNGLTLAGLDANGNVQAAWWAPGMEKWSLANLSAVTGAPKYQGTISAYLTPWNGINIAGTDVNGDLAVVWWVPSFGGQWQLARLNRMFDGPRLTQGSIASWVTPWGGLNVSGLTAAGKVAVYWWTPTSGGWQVTPLSDYIPEVDPPAAGVIGHTSSSGVISLVGLTQTDELVRYWWQAGGQWEGELLSPM